MHIVSTTYIVHLYKRKQQYINLRVILYYHHHYYVKFVKNPDLKFRLLVMWKYGGV